MHHICVNAIHQQYIGCLRHFYDHQICFQVVDAVNFLCYILYAKHSDIQTVANTCKTDYATGSPPTNYQSAPRYSRNGRRRTGELHHLIRSTSMHLTIMLYFAMWKKARKNSTDLDPDTRYFKSFIIDCFQFQCENFRNFHENSPTIFDTKKLETIVNSH